MTDAALRAHGFTPTLIVGLVGAGYTEAKPRTMRAGGKTFAFMRFVITGAGRGCSAHAAQPQGEGGGGAVASAVAGGGPIKPPGSEVRRVRDRHLIFLEPKSLLVG
jgi:hypothetical protein